MPVAAYCQDGWSCGRVCVQTPLVRFVVDLLEKWNNNKLHASNNLTCRCAADEGYTAGFRPVVHSLNSLLYKCTRLN